MTIMARPLSEQAFQAQLIDLARWHGWRVAHFRPARTAAGWRTPVEADGAGWPDLFLTRGDRALAIECKSAIGRLTSQQGEWLIALEQAGIETHVWRPGDYPAAVEVLT